MRGGEQLIEMVTRLGAAATNLPADCIYVVEVTDHHTGSIWFAGGPTDLITACKRAEAEHTAGNADRPVEDGPVTARVLVLAPL